MRFPEKKKKTCNIPYGQPRPQVCEREGYDCVRFFMSATTVNQQRNALLLNSDGGVGVGGGRGRFVIENLRQGKAVSSYLSTKVFKTAFAGYFF